MTTSTEDVLLQVAEVRYKKGEGTLYVMNTRLVWMNENGDKVTLSHRFADIKTQKISPEGKPKIQLQVVLHDGSTTTFHFTNRNGQQAMLADRKGVIDLLHRLLPNFTRKIDKDLEIKKRILSDNPHLLQLYMDLVATKVINSEQFWRTHARDFCLKNKKINQKIGVSADFLAGIKPQVDGCNGLKYNINADVINCIFKTYPAVKLKHSENVPKKLSEAEFWTKFFQSHYFHRDRLTAGIKDMFSECGELDEKILNADLRKSSGDPLYDLKRFGDISLDDGYGSVSSVQTKTNSGNVVHQNMIKRFNQHSAMILRTCTKENTTHANKVHCSNANAKKTSQSATKSVEKEIKKHKRKKCVDEEVKCDTTENPIKKQRLLSKIYYDDLGKPSLNDGVGFVSQRDAVLLTTFHSEEYLQGPMPDTSQELNEDPKRMEEVQSQLLNIVEHWAERKPDRELVTSTAAVNALGELSPGGALMRGFEEQASAQMVPPEFEDDLRALYISLSELLRHFWSAFQPLKSVIDRKAIRMHESLRRFKALKLKPFEERAVQKLSHLGGNLTQHIHMLLEKADTKMALWNEFKMRNAM